MAISTYEYGVVTNSVTTSPPYHPCYSHQASALGTSYLYVCYCYTCPLPHVPTIQLMKLVCLNLFCLQIAKQWVTLIYIEVKREAGHSGDAQQEGMAYHFQDVKEMGFMTKWQTLNPALLLTVHHYISTCLWCCCMCTPFPLQKFLVCDCCCCCLCTY